MYGNRGGSNRQAITVRELRAAPRAAETVLLRSFMRPSRVNRPESRRAVTKLLVELFQRPGDAQLAGVGLTGDAAAVDANAPRPTRCACRSVSRGASRRFAGALRKYCSSSRSLMRILPCRDECAPGDRVFRRPVPRMSFLVLTLVMATAMMQFFRDGLSC